MVDYDPQILDLARAVVDSLGWCEIHTLMDSREAAKRLETEKFDGVIVDVQMPGLDGFELVKRVRAAGPNSGIPIVMFTEVEDLDAMRKGFKAGVTFFMAKPSNREPLYRLLNAVRGAMVMERRRHHRLPYRAAVDCRWSGRGQGQFRAESIDISEGGMSLKPSGGLETGQEVELEFELPQVSAPARPAARARRKSLFAESESVPTGPQKLRARVRYRTPQDALGLEFIALAPAYREVIQKYISGVSPE